MGILLAIVILRLRCFLAANLSPPMRYLRYRGIYRTCQVGKGI
nr:MAG TPA_asm: hypothetical protein [Bacteriophage sp.]